MNTAETTKIIEIIKSAYKETEYLDRPTTIELWSKALNDIPFADASNAVTAWVLEERWPPTIADIRAKAYTLKADPDVMASQAWEQLLRALRMSYAPESEQVWEQLPEATRLIVGGYATFRAWGNTDTASLESVQRPMFVKRFEEIQRKRRKEEAIPRALREPLPRLAAFSPEKAIEEKQPERERVEAPADRMAALRRRLA